MADPLLWRAKLWCSKRHDRYYDCLVFRDRRSMHTYWKFRGKRVGYRRGKRPEARYNWEGQATWWESWDLAPGKLGARGRWKRKPNCGEILLHAGRIGVGIVSHEMTHAASFYIAWDRKLDPHPKNKIAHEKLCLVQGWLVNQFWRHFYKKHPKAMR